MPRGARLDAPGTLHHVMVRGIEGMNIVEDDEDREYFVTRLGLVATGTGTSVYAWALMSNHAHMLLRSGAAGLSTFMRKLLTGYASYFNRRHKRHGHLFQNRYKSIVCEEEPYFLRLVSYIHLNPLRAGLVGNIEELEWSRGGAEPYPSRMAGEGSGARIFRETGLHSSSGISRVRCIRKRSRTTAGTHRRRTDPLHRGVVGSEIAQNAGRKTVQR